MHTPAVSCFSSSPVHDARWRACAPTRVPTLARAHAAGRWVIVDGRGETRRENAPASFPQSPPPPISSSCIPLEDRAPLMHRIREPRTSRARYSVAGDSGLWIATDRGNGDGVRRSLVSGCTRVEAGIEHRARSAKPSAQHRRPSVQVGRSSCWQMVVLFPATDCDRASIH